MKELSDSEMKEVSLDILSYVHKFCLSNDIEYSIAYGTLIGAVRHGGFIPWDDDIDIVMTREHYTRFINLFNQNYPSSYKVHSIENDKKYHFPFAKVEDTRTIKDELGYRNQGIGIDVFPLDKLPNDSKEAIEVINRAKKIRTFIMLKNMRYRSGRSFFKNLTLYVGKLFLLPFSYYMLNSKLIKLATSNSDKETSLFANVVWGTYLKKEILCDKLLNDFVTIKFEGRDYNSIKHYHDYLTHVYGDYMQLPPEEKRVTHHAFKAYWK